MRKGILFLISIVIIVSAIIGGSIYYYSSTSYVAEVNKEKITKIEYNFFFSQVISQMEKTAKVTDENSRNAFWDSIIEGQNAKNVAKDTALEKAKEFKIQFIKAKEKNLVLDESDLTKINTSIDDNVKKAGGEANANQEFLKVYRISFEDYKGILKDLMLVYKYIQEEQKLMTFKDEELNNYYKEKFENEEVKTVIHILFSTVDEKNVPKAENEIADIKKKAEGILERIKKGEDIKVLAKEFSEDPGVTTNEGQYTFKKGEMVKEFEDWAFNAKPGDIDLIKSNFGFHVIKKPKFEEIKDSSVKFALVQNKYYEQLETLKKEQKFNLIKNQKVFDLITVK